MYYSFFDEYITSADDTVYKLANKYYLRWYLWRTIYDPNMNALGDDPFNLPAGKKIKIVELNTEPVIHNSAEGDTWNNLSQVYYGSNRFWTNIAAENDYQHIIPGENLIIPALVSKRDIIKAEELRSVCS